MITIKVTEDGSSTLYSSGIDEHYHSIHGAVQESMHVFIDAGLKRCSSKIIKIIEIGFGTGLNALLTILNCDGKEIVYHAIEKYPIDNKIIEGINYPQTINSEKAANYFKKIHKAPWGDETGIDIHFKLTKMRSDLLEHNFEKGYDLVYFDAFSPNKQPELWDVKIFEQLYRSMNPKAILTTYCAKGSVRRDLSSCGFTVERIPGPPGKREMIRAIKIND